MVWQLELALFAMLVVTAIVALQVRDLIASAAALTIYSFIVAALLAMMGAVDVALTEAALGAGITGALFIGALSLIGRRSVD